MIVRLVALQVDQNRIEDFRRFFENVYDTIRSHPGCLSLQLIRDVEGLGDYFTISFWESLEALEQYRNGDFFRNTWPKVKAFLRERAWAQSFEIVLDTDLARILASLPLSAQTDRS